MNLRKFLSDWYILKTWNIGAFFTALFTVPLFISINGAINNLYFKLPIISNFYKAEPYVISINLFPQLNIILQVILYLILGILIILLRVSLEEFVFRYLPLFLTRYMEVTAPIVKVITAFVFTWIFAALHVFNWAPLNLLTTLVIPFYFILGLLLYRIAEKHGIFWSITVHFFNNLIVALIAGP